ncbi:MAG: hypothetical protein HY585_01855 [Candidatus Omnitrophica bacterium]|nr:hypothetical protein [Candidatus Omnitrophota bacterium]
MKGQEQRRLLPNLTWEAERYFSLFAFILLMMAMLYLLYLIFGTVREVSSTLSPTEQAGLAPVFDRISFLLLIRISILFGVVFIVNFILGLFFLHRLTGPLVRIKSVLGHVTDGNIPKNDVVLRKGDFPTQVAATLSQALKRIRQWHPS